MVDNVDLAVNAIRKNNAFKLIDQINNRLTVESNLDVSIKHINELLNGINVYNISRESNLIKYFHND